MLESSTSKKKLIAFIGKNYPCVDHIIQYAEEYDFKNLDAPTADEVDEINDPLKTRLITYQEELKLVIKDKSKYKADKEWHTHMSGITQ
jgi:PhoPQ-activated pathogenicity-related protein